MSAENEIEREAERKRLWEIAYPGKQKWRSDVPSSFDLLAAETLRLKAELEQARAACANYYDLLNRVYGRKGLINPSQPLLDELKQLRDNSERMKRDLGNANRESLDYKKCCEDAYAEVKIARQR